MSSSDLESIYKTKESLIIRKEGFGGMCYSKESHAYELINDTALSVLQLCDGKRPVKEIISILSDEYDEDRNFVRDTTLSFINQLKEKGYITKVA